MSVATKRAIGAHETGVDTGAWDAGENVRRIPGDATAATLRRMYAWVDPDGNPEAKSSYKFPHHIVSAEGAVGDANMRACSAGMAVLNGGRGGADIPDADRQGVWSHLAGHMRDGDMTPPELRGYEQTGGDIEHKGLALKLLDEAPGTFRAVFSTFNVIDSDGDVTLPGAFPEGKELLVSSWGHKWQELPVGKGIIGANAQEAWIDGVFFLTTTPGKDAYETVKATGTLQEYSYGFRPLEAEMGQFAGQSVRFLKRLAIFEVSPVLQGAGENTRTVAIKGLSLEAQSSEALAAIEDYADRVKALAALRVKEGRVLSMANRHRLEAVLAAIHSLKDVEDDITQLLSETDTNTEKGHDLFGLFLEYQQVVAHLGGG